MRRIMITGGFGFIGSNLIRRLLNKYKNDQFIVLDSMTYAARERYALDVVDKDSAFQHIYVDIRDQPEVRKAIRVFQPDHIIHLAAESHVCRSIDGPRDFVQTNIIGTFNLLEAFRDLWSGHPSENHRFHHVSTDEVYGDLPISDNAQLNLHNRFHENYGYRPRSPYAASKAASDHLVQAWHHTYGMNTVITNCSNNFGPNQHEEKLIPKAILSILQGKPVTLYGEGIQVRDWLFVEEHCAAIEKVFNEGESGETYCIGGNLELSNKEVVALVHKSIERILHRTIDLKLVYTDDRPTDDLRYAIDASKMKKLGWTPYPERFQEYMDETIRWYMEKLWI